ncbi:hypothetical protein ANANG_G00114980 [Anguilla anguilla]|uniref:Uncharacterized protein n=1 Tax=Anguilla anguilla TaxID=7936 RepID=A0A9D3MCI3_ANGAN|nr:hypothetical protein ANANG_G00114980 [Anguilla anguilla]
MKMVNSSSRSSDKNGFSFKKCSAFQFVKRKVRRWIWNPKVNMEKGQGKAFLYPSSKSCQMDQDLWYTQFPPYSCCHLGHGYYLPDDPPCGAEKAKGCKVRKWKMLNRHHGDGKQKAACREQELDGGGPWSLRATPLLATPIMLECCICSGPFVSYAMEEVWQPRERTQAMDLYYPSVPETSYCCANDSDLRFNNAASTPQRACARAVARNRTRVENHRLAPA